MLRAPAVGARRRADRLSAPPTLQFGNTPLHLAAGKGLPRVCRALIKGGADAWARNKARRGPTGAAVGRLPLSPRPPAQPLTPPPPRRALRAQVGETPRRLLRCSDSEACYALLHEFKMARRPPPFSAALLSHSLSPPNPPSQPLLCVTTQVAIATTDYCMRPVHQRGLSLEAIERFANEHPEAWERPTAEARRRPPPSPPASGPAPPLPLE